MVNFNFYGLVAFLVLCGVLCGLLGFGLAWLLVG